MEENKLPNGWILVKVKEIGMVVTGSTPSKSNPSYYDDTYPFYKPSDLYTGHNVIKSTDKLSSLGIKVARFLPTNSILVTCIGATIGKTGIIKKEGACNQQINAIIPSINFNYKFIYYQIIGPIFQKSIKNNASSTTLPILNKTKFENLNIVSPPYSVQQQIVAKIEELFSELDKGVESLKKAQQQLKVFRQAVLSFLFLDANLTTIKDIAETLDQGWSPKCENSHSEDHNQWAVIKTTAVQSGEFIEIENKILPKSLHPRINHELKVGDILITRAGPKIRVGVCCLIRKIRPKLINCDKIYRLRINKKLALPEYVEYVLNSPKCQNQIKRIKTGINDSGVNLTQKRFLEVKIPIPNLLEQEQIVQEIESRLTVCDKIEETITASLLQSDALRQSILKKAFEGKLVDQEELSEFKNDISRLSETEKLPSL